MYELLRATVVIINKQRLIHDLVGVDHMMRSFTQKPPLKGQRLHVVDAGPFGRIDWNEAVLVEQFGVAAEQNLQIAFVGKVQPACAI